MGKSASQLSGRVCGHDMRSFKLQVVLAAYMSRPRYHLIMSFAMESQAKKRLLADCLQSIHHRALASRKQNEFMAYGQI